MGDFNGDGNQDFAVANNGSDTVSAFPGNGDGSFQPRTDYAAGPAPTSVAVGDFNGDGIQDLAVTNSSGVGILLGRGDGSFQAPTSYAAGSNPVSVAVVDFNGDGFPDLAVANNTNPGTVTVLLNAADWPPAVPGQPGVPALHATAQGQPRPGPLSAQPAAHDPQAALRLPPHSTDLPPNPVGPWPAETDRGQPAHPEAASTRTPFSTARHAFDAVFEEWGDPERGGLRMNWLSDRSW
jgi:hypothetical protein